MEISTIGEMDGGRAIGQGALVGEAGTGEEGKG